MLSQFTSDEIQELSMMEIALKLLEEEKQAVNFYDLFNKIAELKGFTQEEKDDRIAQFYTDMNVDGRFLCIGENRWGLRSWYPYDQVDEEVSVPAKTKKKKAKKKLVEDEFDDYDDEDVYDEEEEEDVFDDELEDDDLIDDEEEEEDLDFDDSDDEDEEEDLLEEDEFDLDEEFEEDEEDLEEDEEELDDDEDID